MKVKRKYSLDSTEHEQLAVICEQLCIDLQQMIATDLRHFIKQNRHLLAASAPTAPVVEPAPKQRRNWIEIDTK